MYVLCQKKRNEITTEGGLNLNKNKNKLFFNYTKIKHFKYKNKSYLLIQILKILKLQKI